MKKIAITFGATMLFAAVASAQSYAVQNNSFELPAQPGMGSYDSTGFPGWSHSGGADWGSWWIPDGGFITIGAPDGNQIGYMNGGSVAQQLSGGLVVGTTTVSAYGLTRNDGLSGIFELELWAGGTVSAGVVSGGTMLTSTLYTPGALNSAALVSASYSASASDALLGQTLSVEITQVGGVSQSDFDDVHVFATPEPSTMMVGCFGLTGLILRRRARR